MTLVIIVAVLLALFALAFLTRRRFGVLGLALAAGVLLAQHADEAIADAIQIAGVPVEPFTYKAAAGIILTLLPALLLMIGGPKYLDKRAAIIGAVAFALLGTLLILGPLTTALPTLDFAVKSSLDTIAQYQSGIIAGAIAIAVLDTILLHGAKPIGKHGKH